MNDVQLYILKMVKRYSENYIFFHYSKTHWTNSFLDSTPLVVHFQTLA